MRLPLHAELGGRSEVSEDVRNLMLRRKSRDLREFSRLESAIERHVCVLPKKVESELPLALLSRRLMGAAKVSRSSVTDYPPFYLPPSEVNLSAVTPD